MKLGYYPGCSLHSTALEYDKSFRSVCGKLGIELKEIPQGICCGTIPAVKTSRLLFISLPLKNLSIAELAGINKIVVPCASCFSRFKTALYEIGKNSDLKEEITGITGLPHNEGARVLHPILYFTQLMGLAFGISPKILGLNKHLVDTGPVVSRIPA